jgi:hypothetical protein
MPEACKALGSNLIAEHDRLYGPGTGKAFVEGPYASDLPRALKARIRPVLKRQAAAFSVVEDAPEPAAAATDTTPQVPPSPPLWQSNSVEENGSGLGAKRPTEAATSADHPATERPPAAEIATPSAKPRPGEGAGVKPPVESRLDQSAPPNRAYSLAYVAIFAGAALFGTGRVLGLRMRGFARWKLMRSKPCEAVPARS